MDKTVKTYLIIAILIIYSIVIYGILIPSGISSSDNLYVILGFVGLLLGFIPIIYGVKFIINILK